MNIKKARVLVIDEILSMRRVVTGVLKSMGIESIVESTSVKDALGRLSSTDFDLVITEITLHDGDGFMILKHVRESVTYKNIPVVFVTSETRKTIVMNAIEAGVSGYLVKPFAPMALQDKLEIAWYKYIKEKKLAAGEDVSDENKLKASIGLERQAESPVTSMFQRLDR